MSVVPLVTKGIPDYGMVCKGVKHRGGLEL